MSLNLCYSNLFLLVFASLVLQGCGNPATTSTASIGCTPIPKGGAYQGCPLSLTTLVTTIAGTVTSGHADGTGTAATFSDPNSVTTDGYNIYVTDYTNNAIRKIILSTKVVSVFAGSLAQTAGSTNGTGTSATFSSPAGITTDGANLFVADSANNQIRKIVLSTKVVTTLAGSTTAGFADGTGTAATFSGPLGITTDGTNLYVADSSNNEIRQIVIATGVVTTLAGSTTAGSTDATGLAARFSNPKGITTDGTYLYVADTGNNEIRKIVIATGVVTTLAGSTTSGSANGIGTAATFSAPIGITTDGSSLFVADSGNNQIRKIVIATGVVTTLAGSTTSGSAGGTGTNASFSAPSGITSNGTSLFVTDTTNNLIRKIQ